MDIDDTSQALECFGVGWSDERLLWLLIYWIASSRGSRSEARPRYVTDPALTRWNC